jgi:hypothetical protein
MATLKANGPELLRISRENIVEGDPAITWERNSRVYHANGVVLHKRDVRFRPTASFDPPEGRFYSWGWKKVLAAKENSNPVARATTVLAAVEQGKTPGQPWKVEFKSPQLEAKNV